MSMVSLTIAPLLKTWHSPFEHYVWGLLPLGLFLIITFTLVKYQILTWEDPIQSMLEGDAPDEEQKKLLADAPITSSKEVELVA